MFSIGFSHVIVSMGNLEIIVVDSIRLPLGCVGSNNSVIKNKHLELWIENFVFLCLVFYLQCKVCMQTFICTTSEVKCREHAEAKHPKSDVYACFPHLKKWRWSVGEELVDTDSTLNLYCLVIEFGTLQSNSFKFMDVNCHVLWSVFILLWCLGYVVDFIFRFLGFASIPWDCAITNMPVKVENKLIEECMRVAIR
jgi:hypothetical protein